MRFRFLHNMCAVGITLVMGLSLSTEARADYTTKINPGAHWGIWRGWGSSLCWWANQFGSRDDMADLLYTLKTVSLRNSTGTESLPGLGFNVARYNAGGTSTSPRTVGGPTYTPNNPSSLPAFKELPTYWLDWNNKDPRSTSWNWAADANQRTMMLKAQERGANIFELFSNSPPWWMCNNHSTTGSIDGGSDNLQSWNYDQFALYLATVARYARDNWGITFDSVEPFNEPSSNWWHYPGRQEGCHFDVKTQDAVITALRTELNNQGLRDMPIAASDENTVDGALSTWNGLTAQAKSQVGQINTHGYQGREGDRTGLYNAARSSAKTLWNSEYGENDATGMTLARDLNLDLRLLHPTVWCYWQPFDGGGWGLVDSNPGDNWVGLASPKYFVLAQYTRHIRPGMTMIDGGEDNTVAAYDGDKHRLVIVTTNYGKGQTITYDLSNLGTVLGNSGREIDRWETNTAGESRHTFHKDTFLSGKKFVSWFGPNTVQTFEIDNIY